MKNGILCSCGQVDQGGAAEGGLNIAYYYQLLKSSIEIVLGKAS